MRLIDADLVIEKIKMAVESRPNAPAITKETMNDFSNAINNEPTAYDIEMVVQEFEARKDFCKGEWETFQSEYHRGRYNSLVDAIEIVKRGGRRT